MIPVETLIMLKKAVENGEMSPGGSLELDSYLVLLKDSKAYAERNPGLMPASNFEHEGKEYAVYLR